MLVNNRKFDTQIKIWTFGANFHFCKKLISDKKNFWEAYLTTPNDFKLWRIDTQYFFVQNDSMVWSKQIQDTVSFGCLPKGKNIAGCLVGRTGVSARFLNPRQLLDTRNYSRRAKYF